MKKVRPTAGLIKELDSFLEVGKKRGLSTKATFELYLSGVPKGKKIKYARVIANRYF